MTTSEKAGNTIIALALTMFSLLGVQLLSIIHYVVVAPYAIVILSIMLMMWTGTMVFLARLAREDWVSSC